MQAIIVIGDKTSHGGTVITCSSTCDTHGKGWARVGDKVSCPRCKGIFPVIEGDATLTDEGLPVAYQGCKVACGAMLIASQQFTWTDPSKNGVGNAGEDANENARTGFGSIGSGIAASYQDEPLDSVGQRFRGRFQLVDDATGEPIHGRSVCMRSTGGQNLTGTTDAAGYTQWVERDASEALAFNLIETGAM